MGRAADLIRFGAELAPAIRALIVALFDRHQGNAVEAKREIKRITDHGAQLRQFEAEIDRKMEALKRASKLHGEGG